MSLFRVLQVELCREKEQLKERETKHQDAMEKLNNEKNSLEEHLVELRNTKVRHFLVRF